MLRQDPTEQPAQEVKAEVSARTAIRQARTRNEAEAVAVQILLQKLSSILMRPVEELDRNAPLSKFGLDSLVGIEIRTWVMRELEAPLQIFELLTSESVPALSRHILAPSRIVPPDIQEIWAPKDTRGE